MPPPDNEIMNLGAIVCGDVAKGTRPILYAERTDPVDEADSGWQFSCGSYSDDAKLAQLWTVNEVVESEPSLGEYVGMPFGTALRRENVGAPWEILK
jgi:hypothetical protein